ASRYIKTLAGSARALCCRLGRNPIALRSSQSSHRLPCGEHEVTSLSVPFPVPRLRSPVSHLPLLPSPKSGGIFSSPQLFHFRIGPRMAPLFPSTPWGRPLPEVRDGPATNG